MDTDSAKKEKRKFTVVKSKPLTEEGIVILRQRVAPCNAYNNDCKEN